MSSAARISDMPRVLWAAPRAHSFVRDELCALAPRLPRCVLLCHGEPPQIAGVDVVNSGHWASPPWHPARRIRHMVRMVSDGERAFTPASLSHLVWSSAHNARIEVALDRYGIDVVHSHFAWPAGTGARTARGSRPLVISLRGSDIVAFPEYRYGAMRHAGFRARLGAALASAAVVTVASEGMRMRAIECGANPDKLELLPNGVDVNRFVYDPAGAARWRGYLGATDRRLVVAAASLIPLKRVDVIINAYVAARRRVPELVLAIAGDGPERPTLESLAAECGMATRPTDDRASGQSVRFLGSLAHEQMPALLSAADVFVHAAMSEGACNVVLEAMSCGRPCVSTPTGMAADIFPGAGCGLLVQRGDAAALADAIVHLVREPAQASAMGARASAVIRERYTMDRRVQGFLDIYRRVAR